MTIRRQYSLPNCTLVLEGLSDGSAASQLEMRPVLSILMSAECYVTGLGEPLNGGREFFESLVRTVSSYAQEFMSGVHYPDRYGPNLGMVQLHRIDGNSHRLTVLPAGSDSATQIDQKTELSAQVDLTTVQLFDLVEAIDQFFADTQTLPELSLQLTPISKRYIKSAEPLAKRSLPAVVGVSSLALAAMAFFLVPVPEVQRPRDPVPQPNRAGQNLGTPNSGGSGSPNPNPTPAADGLLGDKTPKVVESSSPTPSTSPQSDTSPLATPQSNISPESTPTPVAEGLASPGAAAVPITDTAEIDLLKGKLSQQIDGVLKNQPAVDAELVYRVSVAKDGAIVGYKSENSAAVDRSEAPLSELLYKPVGTRPPAEPLADFRVVIAPGGTAAVTPW
ncbi:MAG: DUF4335 domain-containing protein [Microcoleus sp. PH2017_29_MFU_D_A]|jgi:hypothetical protein|uniref:DUF4335 domain-containing protein n=1 Tax=unclassified Microcoleus TaxID=2642155 RepID=UPI001D1ED1E5|nr:MULTISPECIES: DUF4335 domain-containing protein [unclassified Microcoleus]MCC3421043.1 DUF4335 domain-containing protein [Microcoleus sp. PH2017_07_MST_O_A]MCC3431973.1 DUF4335 domain-containing protein [Microcoleus sp. PH2017_04_SCI_O_A]MCC3442972.1 DUF4335 domain-containing protein [Microcoleus sp. PH2017_03_ELD_O_A]MCC3465940.1 DUF4335 domain-containing protein [Microcoleus sp. PH2017_06_SFM_O_A]MCC3503984.1 DUF4335 domain-containing protein [Microcoleus sp. PH2017_19_SFW_U_A]MCC3513508